MKRFNLLHIKIYRILLHFTPQLKERDKTDVSRDICCDFGQILLLPSVAKIYKVVLQYM